MPRRISKFLALSTRERWLLLLAAIELPLVALRLWLWGFKHFGCTQAARPAIVTRDEAAMIERARRQAQSTARVVRIAARYGLWASTCLTQSLTLLRLLQRQGIQAELRIGVRKQNGQFEAHAWVESLSMPLNDNGDAGQPFVAFERLTDLKESRLLR